MALLNEHQFEILPAEEAAEIRRRALERMTETQLDNIAHHSLDVQRASRRNCENETCAAPV